MPLTVSILTFRHTLTDVGGGITYSRSQKSSKEQVEGGGFGVQGLGFGTVTPEEKLGMD